MEKFIITNSRGQNLSAVLHKPASQTEKIIIFSHSFKSDKDTDYTAIEFAKRICDEGYAFLRFDFWGSGESDGEFVDSTIDMHIDDLKSVIDFVKEEGYANICLAGLSLGTTVSIMAYDESIKCLLLWSPIFYHTKRYEKYKDIIDEIGYVIEKNNISGKEFKMGKDKLLSFRDINPVERLGEIKCPVLAILGSTDDHITKEKAQENIDMIPGPHELTVIDGGDHDLLNDDAKKKAIEYSTEFIKKYL